MDWETIAPLLVGSILTLAGGIIGSYITVSIERKKIIMERRIETYVNIMPEISKQLGRPGPRESQLEIMVNIDAIFSKIFLFCTEETRAKIEQFMILAVTGKQLLADANGIRGDSNLDPQRKKKLLDNISRQIEERNITSDLVRLRSEIRDSLRLEIDYESSPVFKKLKNWVIKYFKGTH